MVKIGWQDSKSGSTGREVDYSNEGRVREILQF